MDIRSRSVCFIELSVIVLTQRYQDLQIGALEEDRDVTSPDESLEVEYPELVELLALLELELLVKVGAEP